MSPCVWKGTDNQRFHLGVSSGDYRHRAASPQPDQLHPILLCFWRWLLDVTHGVRETTITDNGDTRLGSCAMSLTTITITTFNGINYSQSPTKMAQLLEQNQEYGIIEGYNDKLEEPAVNATATEKAAFKDWMNHHGVAWLTILLGMPLRIQAEYMVVNDAKMLWEKLALTYKSKFKLNICKIREDRWSIKLQDCGDVDYFASRIKRKVKDFNLCAGPTTTDTDTADTDANAKTIANISEQEHIFYLLCGIPRNNECKVILELIMDKNAMMTATPDEVITKLVEKTPACKRQNGLFQKLSSLQRRVAKLVETVMVAKVQIRIREIIRTIGKRRICGSAFIASGEGILQRTAWANTWPSSKVCWHCSKSNDWEYFDSLHFNRELLDGG